MNDNFYWDRITGFASEFKIDARWLLRQEGNDAVQGSLRIVSHPDLRPGYFRAYISLVENIEQRKANEILKLIEDNKMSEIELEVYSAKDKFNVNNQTIEDTLKNIETMFGVKVFGK